MSSEVRWLNSQDGQRQERGKKYDIVPQRTRKRYKDLPDTVTSVLETTQHDYMSQPREKQRVNGFLVVDVDVNHVSVQLWDYFESTWVIIMRNIHDYSKSFAS